MIAEKVKQLEQENNQLVVCGGNGRRHRKWKIRYKLA